MTEGDIVLMAVGSISAISSGCSLVAIKMLLQEKQRNDRLIKGLNASEMTIKSINQTIQDLYGSVAAVSPKIKLIAKAAAASPSTPEPEEKKSIKIESAPLSECAPETIEQDANSATARLKAIEEELYSDYGPGEKELAIKSQVRSIFNSGSIDYEHGPTKFKTQGPAISKKFRTSRNNIEFYNSKGEVI